MNDRLEPKIITVEGAGQRMTVLIASMSADLGIKMEEEGHLEDATQIITFLRNCIPYRTFQLVMARLWEEGAL